MRVSLIVMLAGLWLSGAWLVTAQTPQAPDSPLPLGDLRYEADFAEGDTWQDDRRDDELAWERSDAGFTVRSAGPNASARYGPGTPFSAEDFYAEFAFVPLACPAGDSSLLFNVRSDDLNDNPLNATSYVFVVQCNGTYRSRLVQGGTPTAVDFSGNLPAALTVDAVNTMGVQVLGDEITWFMNGETLGRFVANTPTQAGQFAFGAQLGLQYTVQYLHVWDVEIPAPERATNLEDPLNETIPGRNHVVENFSDPNNPLLVGWAADLPAIRISEQLLTHNAQPFQARLLAAPPPQNFRIFTAQINFQLRQCGSAGGLGLFFGESERDGLAVVTACDGTLSAQRYTDGIATETLLSESIPPLRLFSSGELLQTLWADGTLYIYYNQALVGSIPAPDLAAQDIGLAWTATADTTTRVLIDNFIIAERLVP